MAFAFHLTKVSKVSKIKLTFQVEQIEEETTW